jgi:hypothetical protein
MHVYIFMQVLFRRSRTRQPVITVRVYYVSKDLVARTLDTTYFVGWLSLAVMHVCELLRVMK